MADSLAKDRLSTQVLTPNRRAEVVGSEPATTSVPGRQESPILPPGFAPRSVRQVGLTPRALTLVAIRSRNQVNGFLDQLVRPEIGWRGRPWSAFQLCGVIGFVFAVVLAETLVAHRGLSPLVMAGVVVVAVGSFFGLALATKIVTGQESLVYYRHEILVIVAATGLLRALQQPVLAYLDGTVLGVGLFMACGRIGCLLVGCCHGVPHAFGVRYHAEHAKQGFPACYVGVRLFPIQLIEALFVSATVALGAVVAWSTNQPGSGLTTYVAAYAVGRFIFELLRGDADRIYLGGFSEAQWSSLALLAALAVAEHAGALRPSHWHDAALAVVGLVAAVLALRRRGRYVNDALLGPRHQEEIARAIKHLTRNQGRASAIEVWRTSLDLRISASTIETNGEQIEHYTLSRDAGLPGDTANHLATRIARLRGAVGQGELIRGSPGIYHVLVRPGA